MADISKITLPSGSTYDIKDAGARELISELQKYSDYLGVTSTELTDGATTNPITIDGKQVTAVKGNIVNHGAKEYIFNGTAWQEFGDLSALGKLAYEDQATGKFTPAGTVSQPTFSGNELTATGKFTPAGTIAVGVDAEGTTNYTPEGTINKPAVNVTPQTGTVNSIESVGTLPSATMPTLTTSVENETLTLGWTAGSFDAGSLPTKGADMSVMTGATAELAAAPTFSGTGTSLKATFSGTQGDLSVNGTPAGTVSQPTFSGTQGDVTVGVAD